ncbi:hypothetical protein [Ideonella oryzae]|uniref:Uncharacterized protein n=1 Tax=Ideonella oryzae TaxID=2937441 RepID=A0ABT1BJL4_9BURK|nr:hypothetical protein [Ideonella oryzae]MCO5976396.1 hypothetical protein [Ideonella oryzae]
MAQTSFAFDDLSAPLPASPCRAPTGHWVVDTDFQTGYGIGWDHARHGLLPPQRHLLPGNPLRQGWQAGRRAFAGRTRPAHAEVQTWLQLRIEAWEQGLVFEDLLVTPHFLKQLGATHCPVSREPLNGQAHVVRLNQAAGYAAGNLAGVCDRVAKALPGITGPSALAAARQASTSEDGLFRQLSSEEWARLAGLVWLATPLPHEDAAQLPLRALPPNRVRVLNPIQGLQVWLTLQMELDGWSQRLNRLAERLPEASRLAFRVFVGGFLPRVWQSGRPVDAETLKQRLEDAWADARVLRRWQHFALQLSAAQTERLLCNALSLGVSGRRMQQHAAAGATDGWALESGGRTEPRVRARVQFRPMLRRKPSTASV